MAGARGELSLKFRKKKSGKTYVAEQYFKLPMQVMPPFYQDKDGCCFIYLLNPSGGILQHDLMTIDIVAEKDAKVLVTTPSNNKFYKMDEGYATLKNEIRVLEGGEMEYLPEHNVPFAKSKTYQETTFNLDKNSKLIAFDMATSGRLARGESFLYDIYSNKVKIYVDEELKVYEYGKLEPINEPINKTGILEEYGINASIYFYSNELPDLFNNMENNDKDNDYNEKSQWDILVDNINIIINNSVGVVCGVTMVEDGLGIVRILGSSVPEMQDAMNSCWNCLRKSLLGKEAVRIRKY